MRTKSIIFILVSFLAAGLFASVPGKKSRRRDLSLIEQCHREVYTLDSLHKVYNEQMYLRTSQDSASFFLNVYKLYLACIRLDSADVHKKHHHHTASLMKHNGKNLFSAGKYFYSQRKWEEAWDILELARNVKYCEEYVSSSPINYWMTLSALNMKKPQKVLAYVDNAIKEAMPEARPVLMEDKCHSYITLGDTLRWRQTMETGFRQYPEYDYFRTYAYYLKGLNLCNQALILTNKEEIVSKYKEAQPLMEEVRKQWPDQIDKWGNPLYRIYLNLNMGEEFDEIDSLLRNELR